MSRFSASALFSLALSLLLFAAPQGRLFQPMPENCENGRDDDGDGRIDLNDPDCECAKLEPVSLIPNPSFEKNECCPQTRSELNCADTWIQASEATTDYLHTCGWVGWNHLPPPRPFPDGEACVGFRNGRFGGQGGEPNWKEYAGACLLAPLRARTAYRIRFQIGFTNAASSPPIEVVLFGTTDCKNLPFGVGNGGFGCPTNGPGWIRLGSVNVSGENTWVQTEINTIPPEDIYAIAIGPNCEPATATGDLYYFLDNLVLDKQEAFDFQILPREHPCSAGFYLEAPQSDTLGYQWYKDGVALVGETNSRLQVRTGEGNYQLRVSSAAGCKILKPYQYRIPRFSSFGKQAICAGEAFAFHGRGLNQTGIYETVLKTKNNCDSLVRLSLEVVDPTFDTLNARIFDGESYQLGPNRYQRPGAYEARFTSRLGCDSLVSLNLQFYEVFFPNAFSPDDDGVNDYFTVYGGGDLRQINSLQVFDRWGTVVFFGREMPPNHEPAGWNGMARGRPAPNGIYVFVAKLLMDDGKEHLRHGSVLLIR